MASKYLLNFSGFMLLAANNLQNRNKLLSGHIMCISNVLNHA